MRGLCRRPNRCTRLGVRQLVGAARCWRSRTATRPPTGMTLRHIASCLGIGMAAPRLAGRGPSRAARPFGCRRRSARPRTRPSSTGSSVSGLAVLVGDVGGRPRLGLRLEVPLRLLLVRRRLPQDGELLLQVEQGERRIPLQPGDGPVYASRWAPTKSDSLAACSRVRTTRKPRVRIIR